MQRKKNKQNIDRRKFVGNTVKIVTLGSLLMPLIEACNNKKTTKTGSSGTDTNTHKNTGPKRKSSHPSSKKPRNKWNHESLVMNTKTKVMHLPTSKVYTYYDEIKPNHLQKLSLASWSAQLQEPSRLNKGQSGNIVEILTMQGLKGAINDTSLVIAIDTLSTAFTNEYEKANSMNFRLHELMLQLVALNNAIPADQKWITFNAKVKKPGQLRKRQEWMSTETKFTERINYIIQHKSDYFSRLNKRGAKYSFT
jgi:hypothetical protein